MHRRTWGRVKSVDAFRQGLTLIEVVTSIAILSTMLVMLLLAYAGHTRQIQQAARLQRAVELTDHLLADWFCDDRSLAGRQFGTFPNDVDYSWRVSVKPASTSRLTGEVLQLQTFYVPEGNQIPVLTVELLGDRVDHYSRAAQ